MKAEESEQAGETTMFWGTSVRTTLPLTMRQLEISNIKALSTKALTMSLNPFGTRLFTMLHNAFISQLLGLRASTADLLLRLRLWHRCCDPWFGCDSAVAAVEEEPFKGSPPIVTSVSSIQDDMLEKQKGIKYVKFKAENRFRTLCVATPIELPSNLIK